MYLITNTSQRDSLYVEGIRIGSQQTAHFKKLEPLSLAILKRTPNARIQLLTSKTLEIKPAPTDIDSTTVSTTNKQKPAKKIIEPSKPAESDINADNVVEDKQD